MTREMIKTAREMPLGSAEARFVFQCAPLIVGLRISSLISIHNECTGQIRALLKESGISCFTLCKNRERTAVLFFCRERLREYLSGYEAGRLLGEAGYDTLCLPDILWEFRARYRRYRAGISEFPHELGLILGYPAEDVRGYIQNRGKNALYTGCWKVYARVPEKTDLFRMFELAREMLLGLLKSGAGAPEIIASYRANRGLSFYMENL